MAHATITADRVLTLRQPGLRAWLSGVLGGVCPVYQSPVLAVALVDVPDGAPAPEIRCIAHRGRPMTQVLHTREVRVLSTSITERGLAYGKA